MKISPPLSRERPRLIGRGCKGNPPFNSCSCSSCTYRRSSLLTWCRCCAAAAAAALKTEHRTAEKHTRVPRSCAGEEEAHTLDSTPLLYSTHTSTSNFLLFTSLSLLFYACKRRKEVKFVKCIHTYIHTCTPSKMWVRSFSRSKAKSSSFKQPASALGD